MSKTESTAINELIELVKTQQRVGSEPARRASRMTSTVPPIAGAGEVAPLPRRRAPQGTQRSPSVRVMTAPGTITIPPLPQTTTPPEPATSSLATTPDLGAALRPAPDMTSHQPWFDAGSAPIGTTTDIGTARLVKGTDWRRLLPRLIAPAIGVILLGVAVGVYIVHARKDATGDDAPATTAATPTVVARETPPQPAPRIALVDVRIDSVPAGASVSVVDRGKTTFLGTTPLRSALDPSREYDLVFALPGAATRTEHVAPSRAPRVAVVLTPAQGAAPARSERRTHHRHHAVTPPVAPPVAPPPPAPADEPPAPPVEEAPAPTGDGILMISSKPPAEIEIDGVPTGLMTPQRAIKLAAGKHKITLVNTADQIKKTVTVEIRPDQPTKLIQDLMP